MPVHVKPHDYFLCAVSLAESSQEVWGDAGQLVCAQIVSTRGWQDVAENKHCLIKCEVLLNSLHSDRSHKKAHISKQPISCISQLLLSDITWPLSCGGDPQVHNLSHPNGSQMYILSIYSAHKINHALNKRQSWRAMLFHMKQLAFPLHDQDILHCNIWILLELLLLA